MLPSAANTRSSGVAKPYALMESTPKKRPIMMLSISMHKVTVMDETICVTSISRNSFLIIVPSPLLFRPIRFLHYSHSDSQKSSKESFMPGFAKENS